MTWIELNSEAQIEQIKEESKRLPVLIFKHSTRCAVSSTVLSRLERNWKNEEVIPIKMYYLDLLSYRNISRYIADFFEVEHESPQVLIVKEGSPVYVESHLAISFDRIRHVLSTKN